MLTAQISLETLLVRKVIEKELEDEVALEDYLTALNSREGVVAELKAVVHALPSRSRPATA